LAGTELVYEIVQQFGDANSTQTRSPGFVEAWTSNTNNQGTFRR
jgi:hypothetical protein